MYPYPCYGTGDLADIKCKLSKDEALNKEELTYLLNYLTRLETATRMSALTIAETKISIPKELAFLLDQVCKEGTMVAQAPLQ